MNFIEEQSLLYFCVQNSCSSNNRPEDNQEVNSMLRKGNFNITMEFLNCMKNNDSVLGLYNANQYVRMNNGAMKYKYQKNKGTMVMFTFKLKNCEELEVSPSIFTDRSLLNTFNKSDDLIPKNYEVELIEKKQFQGKEIVKKRSNDLFEKIEKIEYFQNYQS